MSGCSRRAAAAADGGIGGGLTLGSWWGAEDRLGEDLCMCIRVAREREGAGEHEGRSERGRTECDDRERSRGAKRRDGASARPLPSSAMLPPARDGARRSSATAALAAACMASFRSASAAWLSSSSRLLPTTRDALHTSGKRHRAAIFGKRHRAAIFGPWGRLKRRACRSGVDGFHPQRSGPLGA